MEMANCADLDQMSALRTAALGGILSGSALFALSFYRNTCFGLGSWCISEKLFIITKTRLYYFNPLKPHFYMLKLGFTGVYIIFLISAQNIDCRYMLELPH